MIVNTVYMFLFKNEKKKNIDLDYNIRNKQGNN